jgi:CBS domain-containing protein
VLGGMTRMTLTLSTILVEATHDIALLLPIMLALAISRAVGDAFTHSFDDGMMRLLSLPYLEEQPPRVLEVLTAHDVMRTEVVTLSEVCTVGDVMRVLSTTSHNGFPVLGGGDATRRLCVGMILRRQLLVLLEERVWLAQASGMPVSDAVREAFVSSFSSRHALNLDVLIHDLAEEAAALTHQVDLRAFIDPSPLVISSNMTLTRVYHLFNLIGMRHLPVADREMNLVGIVTRKDMLPESIELRISGDAKQLYAEQSRRSSSGWMSRQNRAANDTSAATPTVEVIGTLATGMSASLQRDDLDNEETRETRSRHTSLSSIAPDSLLLSLGGDLALALPMHAPSLSSSDHGASNQSYTHSHQSNSSRTSSAARRRRQLKERRYTRARLPP